MEQSGQGDVKEAQATASGPGGEASERCGTVSAWCDGTSGHWCRMQKKQKPAPYDTSGGPQPPTCPLLTVAELCTCCVTPCLLHAHTGSAQAGVELKGTYLRAAPGHPTLSAGAV